MATEGLNKIFCGTDIKNTGICECFFDPKLLEGALLVPKDKVFTEDELSDANIAATMAALILANKNLRIFPIQGFVQITDNSEEDTIQTFGYGGQADAKEGNYNWFFQFVNGGLNLSNALRTFNGLTGKYRAVFIDLSQNTILGTSRKDANGDNGLGGIPLERLKTAKWKPADGTNTAVYGIHFSFKAPYINELIAFKKVSIDSLILSELNGLEDIKLTITEADDTGDVVTITAATDCGSTDLYDLYADEFANEEAWVVKNAAGDPITVTVVKNETAKGWDITYTTADVTDGDTITLAAPSVLAVAPVSVVGYEGDTVTVELGS